MIYYIGVKVIADSGQTVEGNGTWDGDGETLSLASIEAFKRTFCEHLKKDRGIAANPDRALIFLITPIAE